MFQIFIILIIGYFVYRHAKGRGHDTRTAGLWAAGCAVIPYIGIPLYLIFGGFRAAKRVPKDDDAIDIEATVVEDTISCPMCGRKVQEELNTCPYCSYTLKLQCTACGQELQRDWKTCPHCGTAAPHK
jgi:RNA polymerase subunit RPABC4/transcription elongation factor Spt4